MLMPRNPNIAPPGVGLPAGVPHSLQATSMLAGAAATSLLAGKSKDGRSQQEVMHASTDQAQERFTVQPTVQEVAGQVAQQFGNTPL